MSHYVHRLACLKSEENHYYCVYCASNLAWRRASRAWSSWRRHAQFFLLISFYLGRAICQGSHVFSVKLYHDSPYQDPFVKNFSSLSLHARILLEFSSQTGQLNTPAQFLFFHNLRCTWNSALWKLYQELVYNYWTNRPCLGCPQLELSPRTLDTACSSWLNSPWDGSHQHRYSFR